MLYLVVLFFEQIEMTLLAKRWRRRDGSHREAEGLYLIMICNYRCKGVST
jgi:hypothetical protein